VLVTGGAGFIGSHLVDALLDRGAEVAIADHLHRSPRPWVAPRTALDSLATAERPMIRAGVEDVRAAEAAQRGAHEEIWPDLQVGVQYAQRGGAGAPSAGGTERMGSLMLGASIPVFARDRQLRMREEAAAMTRMAQADLAALRAETRGKIGEAYASLERARSLAKLYRTAVLPQAEAAVGSALSAYRVGQVDFMTLLDDRMTVNKYREELATLEADEGKAWAELEMLTGRELLDPHAVAATAMEEGGVR